MRGAGGGRRRVGMRLLFVKLKHIGDSLLLTPTLAAARAAYPEAQIWVVVRRGSEGILGGCTAIDRLLTTAAPAGERGGGGFWQDTRLVRLLRRESFDAAFELGGNDRGRWLVALSGARRRVARAGDLPRFWRPFFHHRVAVDPWMVHQVELDYRPVQEALEMGSEIPPLQFDETRADLGYVLAHGLKDYLVLHPATRWRRKEWPRERWVELAGALAAEGQRLVLSSGPDPEEVRLCREIHEQSSGAESKDAVLVTGGALKWAEVAGLLFAAKLFVGVDTAAMHLAAACATPVIALFGSSWETHWRPWRCPHRIVAPPVRGRPATDYDRIMAARARSMDEIPVSDVLAACRAMLGAR